MVSHICTVIIRLDVVNYYHDIYFKWQAYIQNTEKSEHTGFQCIRSDPNFYLAKMLQLLFREVVCLPPVHRRLTGQVPIWDHPTLKWYLLMNQYDVTPSTSTSDHHSCVFKFEIMSAIQACTNMSVIQVYLEKCWPKDEAWITNMICSQIVNTNNVIDAIIINLLRVVRPTKVNLQNTALWIQEMQNAIQSQS